MAQNLKIGSPVRIVRLEAEFDDLLRFVTENYLDHRQIGNGTFMYVHSFEPSIYLIKNSDDTISAYLETELQ